MCVLLTIPTIHTVLSSWHQHRPNRPRDGSHNSVPAYFRYQLQIHTVPWVSDSPTTNQKLPWLLFLFANLGEQLTEQKPTLELDYQFAVKGYDLGADRCMRCSGWGIGRGAGHGSSCPSRYTLILMTKWGLPWTPWLRDILWRLHFSGMNKPQLYLQLSFYPWSEVVMKALIFKT